MLRAGLGAVVTVHDDGSRHSMYDLTIVYRDGRRAAAEVVSTRHGPTLQQLDAIGKRRHSVVPELIRTWLVVVRPGTVVKRLAVELPELLAELETACVTGIGPGWQPLWWGPVQQLGLWSCVSGGATPEELPGYWLLAQPTATWGSSAVAVVEACEEFLAQTADVGTKLAGAGLTERHAVVLVTPEWLGELVSIEDGVVPTRAPTLPDGVDRVWLVTRTRPRRPRVLARAASAGDRSDSWGDEPDRSQHQY